MKDKANKSNSLKGNGKVTGTPNKGKKMKKTGSDRETIGVDDKLLGDDLEIKKAGEIKKDACAEQDTGENHY
ncbi:MAG: hypothetical protein JWP81_1439 [Ferruginibacter sp.]|nr:hypothetical protein [Ferruginibacter sp.]